MTESCATDKFKLLWLRVLHQAVMEANGEFVGWKGNHGEIDFRSIQRNAQEWLTGDSVDLRGVCHLAGMGREDRIRLVRIYREKYGYGLTVQ